MAKQVIFEEQKFWVFRNEDGGLYFFEQKDFDPIMLSDEEFFGSLCFVDDPDFIPFVKPGDEPTLCAVRAVKSFNFNIRANVERGIATRDRDGVFVYKSVSQSELDDILIFDAEFLPVVYDGSLYCVEIQKVRK